jgi:16S rRNA (uracil1498-N3)-methyltransferase
MTRRRFLVEKFEEGKATLRGEQARHLATVLRAKPGQLLELSDGDQVWLGRVETVNADLVEFTLVEKQAEADSCLRIVLMVALIKFNRFEDVLEKATELGVTEIVPLQAARSVKHLAQAAPGRIVRWEKIILNAAQQARRAAPPLLAQLISPVEAFAGTAESVKIMLSEKQGSPLVGKTLGEMESPLAGVTLAIGPEGGWTEDELDAARNAGFVEASLGSNILRTDTAAVAALAVITHELLAAGEGD